MTVPRILFVDDDKENAKYYLWAFQRRFNVHYCKTVEGALTKLNYLNEFAAAVIDIRMEPGERYSQYASEEGVDTGYFLYQDIRRLYDEMPIFVLTIVAQPRVLAQFAQAGDALLYVHNKFDMPPHRLTEQIWLTTNSAGSSQGVGE